MTDINRHRLILVQILKDIYSDARLSGLLGFKGGSALMFFYDLPRFSVDLDFNLLDREKEDFVHDRVREILIRYGTISDEAMKFHGPLLVLDYGTGERKLKVEISNRLFNDSYEIRNLLGINVRVMVLSDMFAHKLCALLDRRSIAGRDIFDCWFLMNRRTPVNIGIIETRMNMPYKEYIQKCIEMIETLHGRNIMQGIGELPDENMKKFVRTGLRSEIITLLKFYKDSPVTGD
jgi:predicted nucleotidyltransferase component of viral defense system